MLAIGLNQTFDRTIDLAALRPGDVLRATGVTISAGGKALNVCRAAQTLGVTARLAGPFPGALGRVALDLAAAEGLTVEPLVVDGELRGTTVVIEADGRTTVINEPGPPLAVADWSALLRLVGDLLADERGRVERPVAAISGSAPPNTPPDAHRQLIALIRQHRGWVAVDVTGERLLDAARAGADLVKPNLSEAEHALALAAGQQRPLSEAVHAAADPDEIRERAVDAARRLVELGARRAAVSAGAVGVAHADPTASGFVVAPTVAVVNPVGAGDALVGATLVAIARGASFVTALTDGVAYAAAAVAHPVAGYADLATYERLRSVIHAEARR